MAAGVKNIIGCDQAGALYRGRTGNMNWVKDWYAQNSNPNNEQGTVHEVIKGADVFLGLSVPGVIDETDVKNMALSAEWRPLRERPDFRSRIKRSFNSDL